MATRLLTATLFASGLTHVAGESSGLSKGFGPSVEAAESRAPDIFNAINDAMRQWGSSVHHNGMSFYLATVPEGVILHHGNSHEESPDDPDWLAYEIEHAEHFARGRHGGPPGGGPPGGPGHGGPPSDGHGGPPFDKRADRAGFDLINIAKDDNPQQVMVEEESSAQPQASSSDEGKGGWLHTYRTTRPLRYLYVDGMGGGKTSMGTLDTQDYLLRGDKKTVYSMEKPPPRHNSKRSGGPMDEQARAVELCEMCSKWNLSGVVRMEAGFEIIQCDFFDGLEPVQTLQRPSSGEPRGPPGPFENFEFIRGLSERYFDIGSSRTFIDFSSMVSAFFYPVNLTNPDPKRPDLPRLSSVSEAELEAIKTHLGRVIPERFNDPIRSIDWQDVTDLIVGRYADRLQAMVEKESSSDDLLGVLNFLLTVYIDYSGRDKDHQISTAIDRCANFYLHGIHPSTEADFLIHAAVKSTTKTICTKLFDAREILMTNNTSAHSSALSSAVDTLRSLMEYLGWARFKRCTGCSIDEVCLIPMWPFGSKQDYESPRCVNKSSSGHDGDENYWGGGPGGGPGGGGPGRGPPGGGRGGRGPP